jgi:hypothetical protein
MIDGPACWAEENEQEDRWAFEKKQVQLMRGPTRAGGSLRDLETFMDAAAERVDIWMLRRWCIAQSIYHSVGTTPDCHTLVTGGASVLS